MMNFIRACIAVGTAMSMIAFAVGPARAAEPASVAAGAQTWADNCDRCHNMRDPSDFDSVQWRVIVTHMRIRAGLTGSEARDVLEFLTQSSARSTQTAAQTSSNAARVAAAPVAGTSDGQRIYEGTCIACHGPGGKGTIAGVPDLTAEDGPLSQPDSVLLANVENGLQSPGSPLAMPPKGGNRSLTDADLEAVLRYIRSAFGH
jgi:mono/diheme cytochrome c family protein